MPHRKRRDMYHELRKCEHAFTVPGMGWVVEQGSSSCNKSLVRSEIKLETKQRLEVLSADSGASVFSLNESARRQPSNKQNKVPCGLLVAQLVFIYLLVLLQISVQSRRGRFPISVLYLLNQTKHPFWFKAIFRIWGPANLVTRISSSISTLMWRGWLG